MCVCVYECVCMNENTVKAEYGQQFNHSSVGLVKQTDAFIEWNVMHLFKTRYGLTYVEDIKIYY